jgi:hypothetical protein
VRSPSFDQLYYSTYHQIVDTIAPSKPMVIEEVSSARWHGLADRDPNSDMSAFACGIQNPAYASDSYASLTVWRETAPGS